MSKAINASPLLMRHCAPLINAGVCLGQLDVPLNVAGAEHAEQIAIDWKMPPPSWIVCSDLLRAQQTAMPIAKRFGLAVQLDARLRELAMGEFTGRSWDEIHASEPKVLARWGEHFVHEGAPGGESYISQQTRVCAAFTELQTRPGAGLIVMHQGALRALFAHLQSAAPELAIQWAFGYGEIISAVANVLSRQSSID